MPLCRKPKSAIISRMRLSDLAPVSQATIVADLKRSGLDVGCHQRSHRADALDDPALRHRTRPLGGPEFEAPQAHPDVARLQTRPPHCLWPALGWQIGELVAKAIKDEQIISGDDRRPSVPRPLGHPDRPAGAPAQGHDLPACRRRITHTAHDTYRKLERLYARHVPPGGEQTALTARPEPHAALAAGIPSMWVTIGICSAISTRRLARASGPSSGWRRLQDRGWVQQFEDRPFQP